MILYPCHSHPLLVTIFTILSPPFFTPFFPPLFPNLRSSPLGTSGRVLECVFLFLLFLPLLVRHDADDSGPAAGFSRCHQLQIPSQFRSQFCIRPRRRCHLFCRRRHLRRRPRFAFAPSLRRFRTRRRRRCTVFTAVSTPPSVDGVCSFGIASSRRKWRIERRFKQSFTSISTSSTSSSSAS